MNFPIVAFTGKMLSGKTTCAKHLIKKGFIPVNFKDALIVEVKERFPGLLKNISSTTGVPVSKLFTEKPPLMRALLQCYGTDVRRRDYENYWVDKWRDTMAPLWAQPTSKRGVGVVADDCRFKGEARAVNEKLGYIIRVIRKGVAKGSHASEKEMDEIAVDYTIENDGTIKDLHDTLDNIMHQICKKC